MTCADLASRIQLLEPNASHQEVARLCLLMANSVESLDELEGDNFNRVWREVGMRLNAATDQHAAMTEDLETLAAADMSNAGDDEIFTLLRALRVQTQVLKMYVGEATASAK